MINEKSRCWCEVSLDAITHNFKEYKKRVSENTKILCVVKANAYGHGAEVVAKHLVKCGADYLAVACVDEAIELRSFGIKVPILILGYTVPERTKELLDNDIIPAVYNISDIKKMSEIAESENKILKVHIKADTGMSRIGFLCDDAEYKNTVLKIKEIKNLKNIDVEGLFTHFACADEENTEHVKNQFFRFKRLIDELEKENINIKLKHCCNSAAALRFKDMHLDMVRVGISLYGLYPSDIKYDADLIPAMQFKTSVSHVKYLKKGETISYGATYKTTENIRVATIQAGYADGFSRILSGKANVIVDKKIVPVLGKICMDQCMINVSCVNNINVGDEVILFGTDGINSITADETASLMGTISYELICMINRRVPRIYTKCGVEDTITNYLN